MTQMSPTNQIKALALLDGYEPYTVRLPDTTEAIIPNVFVGRNGPVPFDSLPNYLNDRNAIQRIIYRLDADMETKSPVRASCVLQHVLRQITPERTDDTEITEAETIRVMLAGGEMFAKAILQLTKKWVITPDDEAEALLAAEPRF
jgi:hypothetical protein